MALAATVCTEQPCTHMIQSSGFHVHAAARCQELCAASGLWQFVSRTVATYHPVCCLEIHAQLVVVLEDSDLLAEEQVCMAPSVRKGAYAASTVQQGTHARSVTFLLLAQVIEGWYFHSGLVFSTELRTEINTLQSTRGRIDDTIANSLCSVSGPNYVSMNTCCPIRLHTSALHRGVYREPSEHKRLPSGVR